MPARLSKYKEQSSLLKLLFSVRLWLPLSLASVSQTGAAQVQVPAVTSSAGFTPGLPQIGSLASIGLTGLQGVQGIQSAIGWPLPFSLAGVSVTVNGSAAPISAVADMGYYQQINIQVPYYQAQLAPTMIEVSQPGQRGQLNADLYANSAVGAGEWGVFFEDASGYGVAQHADYSLVTVDDPANPGESLAIYCTNLDAFTFVLYAPSIGYAAQPNPPPTLIPGTYGHFSHLTMNGENVQPIFAGLSPGSVGLFQINFRVPDDIPDGDSTLQAVTESCNGSALCPAIKMSQPVKIPVRGTALPAVIESREVCGLEFADAATPAEAKQTLCVLSVDSPGRRQ
jgi:uncharacterized protein (TIGR03437 family)